MPKKPKAIVLDSWAIVAYLDDEAASEQVADLIADANEDGTPLLMSVVSLGEVWHLIARGTSAAEADRSLTDIQQLGIKTVEADWQLAREAAGLKARYGVSYTDGFAAALAKQMKAHLATGDPEFAQLEKEIQIIWLKQE
ncbi:MAG: type II toxin-antitoxin system VapC family toxin [Blastocatellia bacterium]